jgi:hypothetical protein
MRDRPRFVAIAISTARMLRLVSAVLASLRPPVWVKPSKNPVLASSSMSSEAIGANGSMPASSSLSVLASAGMSSADSGGTTRWSSSSRRTVPVSSADVFASVCSSSSRAACSSSLPCCSAAAAEVGLPTSRQ